MRRVKIILAAAPAVALMLVLWVFPAVAQAATPLPNGLTAAVVATSNQTIHGVVNATGYDIGIYIGPGVHNVSVNGATVSGANDQGILVQDASNVLIENSTVSGNATNIYTLPSGDKISESKGIVLAGARNCQVRHNKLTGNGDGGISVLDDGPQAGVFAPTAISTSPIAGTGNVIAGNLIKDNPGGCGIVVSAKNPGGGVSHNLVVGNRVLGFDPAIGDLVPGVGGIIVAGGSFGPVNVSDNVLLGNVIIGGLIPGISLHAFGPAVISGTELIGNVMTYNGGAGDKVANDSTGIEIFAVPNVGTISGTEVLGNLVSNDHFGVWHVNDTATHIVGLKTIGVAVPVFP